MRITYFFLSLVFISILVIISSCSNHSTDDENIIITDIRGKEWDVTHARDMYGMDPAYFNFGIGVGGIKSYDAPTIVEEGDSGYPEPDSNIQVFGVNHNGEQRAYIVSQLSRHEVFNDVYPGEAEQYVAVTFWPLADLAVVYSREIDGNILNIAPSGWTYGDNIGRSVFVLMDKETESIWFPIDQQCCVLPIEDIGSDSGLIGIGGSYADSVLKEIQVLSTTTWAEWKKAFPDTKLVRE